MADRPGLDDNANLNRLIELWREGQGDIDARGRRVVERIIAELSSGTVDANVVFRLKNQAKRLEDLSRDAELVIEGLANNTRQFVLEDGIEEIYTAGAVRAGGSFRLTSAHRAAVDQIAQDLFDDVLVLTTHIDEDTKDYVRRVGRKLTGFKLTGGVPVKTQARRLAKDLRADFRRRGIGAVVYRDGSRHGFGEYAEMLLRTKTGVAYNMGTLNQARGLGIEYYEILDGALCGLTFHHDPRLANGLIVDRATAVGFPLAHPNCRRSINPRPDLTRDNVGEATSVQAPEARADQAAFEEALRQQGRARRRRRAQRQARAGRAQRSRRTRSPRAGR